MKFLTTLMIAGLVTGATTTVAKADLDRAELRTLRLSPLADRNRDGNVTAEEILLIRPDAFDQDGDGRLNAVEHRVALRWLDIRGLE